MLQISYDNISSEIITHTGYRKFGEPIKLTKTEKEAIRPVLQQRLRRTACPKACCKCAYNGWSTTRRTYGAGCIKKRLANATTINEMRNLMSLAWGAIRDKPYVWKMGT